MTYWGRQAAGLLLFSGDRVLLTLRSEEVLEPGTWGVPGGAIHDDETPYDGALREAQEELGAIPPHVVFGEVVYEDGSFRYTTFLARMRRKDAKDWKPRLNWENDDARWIPVRDLPDDLHFGLEYVRRERPDLFGSRMTRNMDESLRGLERQAAGGDPAARRRLLRQRFRAGVGPGPALAATIQRLVDSANELADEGSGVTVAEVAQIVRAVLAPPEERRDMRRHQARWATRTHHLPWPGTAFAWVTGHHVFSDDPEVASRRVTHALAVVTPDGNITIGVAPTSELDRQDDERDFSHYRPSIDPIDAWPHALPQGYTGFGFMDAPVLLHDNAEGDHVGGEGPRPFTSGDWYGYQSLELESGLYQWALVASPDRVTVFPEEAEAFAYGFDAPDPTWW